MARYHQREEEPAQFQSQASRPRTTRERRRNSTSDSQVQHNTPGAGTAVGKKALEKTEFTAFMFHENIQDDAELLVNAKLLPQLSDGGYVEVWKYNKLARDPPHEHRVVLQVKVKEDFPGSSYFSIRNSTKEAFDLGDKSHEVKKLVMVSVKPESVLADHVELYVKAMFMPRGDLYRMMSSIVGKTVYGSKTFPVPGDDQGKMRVKVHQVSRNSQAVYAGVVSNKTHVICRSRSSRIFWLVQLTPEMYDTNQDGDVYYEVFLRFVEDLLERWREMDVTHHLTVVFFCRVYFAGNKGAEPVRPAEGLYKRPIRTAPDGRLYEDTYKVVVANETKAEFDGCVKLRWRLHDEFHAFPREMGWWKLVNLNTPTPAAAAQARARGAPWPSATTPAERSLLVDQFAKLDLRSPGVRLAVPALAKQGNVVEALNVIVNVLEKHYLDRDLTRSGNSVVMITAGQGVFNVDGKLSAITTQRMMDNGIGMDMVSLSGPPIHTAPLFISKRLVKETVPLAPANGKPPLQQQEISRQEAVTAAALLARQFSQQPQLQQQYGGTVSAAAATTTAARSRRSPSLNSEEVLVQETPKYELPHWMNLTFAAAVDPRNRHQDGEGPQAVPAGLLSTTPPAPEPPRNQRPVTMPKLIWPEQLRWKPNGTIDMKSLDMPFVLKKLLEWRHDHPDMIDIAGPPDPEDDDDALERRKAEATKWDENNKVRPYRLRKWHAVEQKFPQPPHGIEGAAEHARVLRKARKKLRKELAAAAAAGAGTDGAAALFAIGGDDFRLKSPSGSVSSMCGRLVPPEVPLGTSPGTVYSGSPRSLGRMSTLSQFARPFKDKDPYVGVAAQPSLKISPRGAYVGVKPFGGIGVTGTPGGVGDSGGGGSGSGGWGGGGAITSVSGGVAEAEAVATMKPPSVLRGGETEKAARRKAWPEDDRKKMGDEAFALFVPKWRGYDNSVDQPPPEKDELRRGSLGRAAKTKTPQMGDWGSLPVDEDDEDVYPARPGVPSSNVSVYRMGMASSGPTAVTTHLSSPKQGTSSLLDSGEVGGGAFSLDGGSPTASLHLPANVAAEHGLTPTNGSISGNNNNNNNLTGDKSSSSVALVQSSGSTSASGPAQSRPGRSSPAMSAGYETAWGGKKLQQDVKERAAQPSTSPGGSNLWQRVGEKPQRLDLMHGKMLERAERRRENAAASAGRNTPSSGSGSSGHAATSKSPVTSVRSLSDSSPVSGGGLPRRSPAGPNAYVAAGTPPKLTLGKSRLGKSPDGHIAAAGDPRSRSPGPPPAPSGGSSISRGRIGGRPRQQRRQEGEKESPPGRGSATTAATTTSPVKIHRTLSDGRRSPRSWGKRAPKMSSPRAVPVRGGDSCLDHSAKGRGLKTQGRPLLGTGGGGGGGGGGGLTTPLSSSAQQQQQQLSGSWAKAPPKGVKLDIQLGRWPDRRPLDYSSAAPSRSHDSGVVFGIDQNLSQAAPSGLSSDNNTNEAFEHDGRLPASYSSTNSGSGFAGFGGRGGLTGGGGGGGGGGLGGTAGTSGGIRDPSGARSRFSTGDSSLGRSRVGTMHSSETGGGGGGGGKSRPVMEQEFNPFQTADEQQLLRIRTHNRRRWSHVFSRGETEFHTTDTMPGPIYRSLCQPVLLPTSIDYVPSQKILKKDYVESTYDLAIDKEYKNRPERAKLVVEEMVAQRIAQDFQLVEQPADTNVRSRLWVSYQQLAKRGLDFSTDKQFNQFFTVGEGLVYIVSMGHRLQTMSFNQANSTVKVRKFTLKAGMDSGNSAYEYRYSLWLPMTGYAQPVKQEFFKYPKPEYNFNYVDQLISGDQEDLWEFTKYRRLLYNIVPPKVTDAEEESAFADALDKFAEHLNSERRLPDDPRESASSPVSFTFHRKFPAISVEGDEEEESGAADEPVPAASAAAAVVAAAATNARRRFSHFSGLGERKTAEPVEAEKTGPRVSGRGAGGRLCVGEAKSALAVADAAPGIEGPMVVSSQSVRIDMTTRAPVAGSGDAVGSGRLGGGSVDNSSRGSGRVKDPKDSRDARDRRRDNRDGKTLPVKDRDRRNGKDASGDGGVDRGEETGTDEDQEAPPHKEWLDVVHDKEVSVSCILHVDVQWLLCSAAKVTEYVTSLRGCAHDLQLHLIQVPTYARVPEINMHPLVTHPYIELPPCSPQEEKSILLSVQNHMVESKDYVRCRDVATDWKSYGLPVPPPSVDITGKVYAKPLPIGRAFMHRTGAVFVRVAPGGLVLLPNGHWRDNGEYDTLLPGRNGQLQQRLRETLNDLVVVTHNTHTLVNSVINKALDTF